MCSLSGALLVLCLVFSLGVKKCEFAKKSDEALEKLHRFASTLMNLLDGHKKKNLHEKQNTDPVFHVRFNVEKPPLIDEELQFLHQEKARDFTKAVPVDKNDTSTTKNLLPGEQCLSAAKDRENAHCSKSETSLKVHKAGFPAPKITLKPYSIEKRLLAHACLKCSNKRKEKVDPRFESKKYMSLLRFRCLMCFATMKKNKLNSSANTSKRAAPGKQDLAVFNKHSEQNNFRSPTSFLLDTDDRKFYRNAMLSNSSTSGKVFADANSRPIVLSKQDSINKNVDIAVNSKSYKNSHSFQIKENSDAAGEKKFFQRDVNRSDNQILRNRTKPTNSECVSSRGCSTTNDLNAFHGRHSNALLDAANIVPKMNVQCQKDSKSYSKRIYQNYQRSYSRHSAFFSKNSNSEQQLSRVQKCGHFKPRQYKSKCSNGLRNSSGISGSHLFDRTSRNSERSSKNKVSLSCQPKVAPIALLPADIRKNKPNSRNHVSKSLKKYLKTSDFKTKSFQSQEKAKVPHSLSRTEEFNSKISDDHKSKHLLPIDHRLICTQQMEKKSNNQIVTDQREAEINLNCSTIQTQAVILPKQELSSNLISSVGTASSNRDPIEPNKSPLGKDFPLIETKVLESIPSIGSCELNAASQSKQSCNAEDTKSKVELNEAKECNVPTITKSNKVDLAVLAITKSMEMDAAENDAVRSLGASANMELEAHNTVKVKQPKFNSTNASVSLKKVPTPKQAECPEPLHCESVQCSDALQPGLASDCGVLPAWFQDDLPTLEVKDTKRKRRLTIKKRLNKASPMKEVSDIKVPSVEDNEPCPSPLKKQKVCDTDLNLKTDHSVMNLPPEDNFDLDHTSDFVDENDFLVLDEVSSPCNESTELETKNLEEVTAVVSSTADEAIVKTSVEMPDCIASNENLADDKMVKTPVELFDCVETTNNFSNNDLSVEVSKDSCRDHYFTYKSMMYFWPITFPSVEEIQNMSDDDSDDKTNYCVSVKLMALENSGFVPKCFVENLSGHVCCACCQKFCCNSPWINIMP